MVIAMNKTFLQWMFLLFVCTFSISSQPIYAQDSKPPVLDDKTGDKSKDKKPAHAMSTKDVADKLQKGLDSKNAAYNGSNIKAVVDDQSVILNGTVNSQSQHEMALQLAGAYGGDRKIVDHLVVQR
jgi:osmotically-inducible protein OsmY